MMMMMTLAEQKWKHSSESAVVLLKKTKSFFFSFYLQYGLVKNIFNSRNIHLYFKMALFFMVAASRLIIIRLLF